MISICGYNWASFVSYAAVTNYHKMTGLEQLGKVTVSRETNVLKHAKKPNIALNVELERSIN